MLILQAPTHSALVFPPASTCRCKAPVCKGLLDSFVAGTERPLISIPPSRFASRQELLPVIIWTRPLRPASRCYVFVDSSRLLLTALPGFTVSVSRTATCWISNRSQCRRLLYVVLYAACPRLLVSWEAVMCSVNHNCRYLCLAVCDPSAVSSDLIECLVNSSFRVVFPDWRSHALHPCIALMLSAPLLIVSLMRSLDCCSLEMSCSRLENISQVHRVPCSCSQPRRGILRSTLDDSLFVLISKAKSCSSCSPDRLFCRDRSITSYLIPTPGFVFRTFWRVPHRLQSLHAEHLHEHVILL